MGLRYTSLDAKSVESWDRFMEIVDVSPAPSNLLGFGVIVIEGATGASVTDIAIVDLDVFDTPD